MSDLLSKTRHPTFAATALGVAMLIGGSGSLNPLPEVVLQLFLTLVTLIWIWMHPVNLRYVPRAAWIIAGIIVAVPLCQLLPLPAMIWHILPGRSIEWQALALVGQDSSWRPFSLTPNRTLASLLCMIAAAAVLVMAAAQDRQGRTILIVTTAVIALFSVIVGAAQLAGGDYNVFRFYNPVEPYVDGFQTNHNAEADVLLMGLVALSAAVSEWAGSRKVAAARWQVLSMVGGPSLLLLLGVVLTASRTGIALLAVADGAQIIILWRWLRRYKHQTLIAGATVVAVLGVATAALGQHGALARVVARFATPTELRPQIWKDAVFALRQYWPWGSGMGSFIPVFAAIERLEIVTNRFVNRAHNEYIEFMIEAGLPGILAFSLICRQLFKHAWQQWRERTGYLPAQLICGTANLMIIAMHSLDDYPLRTMSIASMAALSGALMLPIVKNDGLPSTSRLTEH